MIHSTDSTTAPGETHRHFGSSRSAPYPIEHRKPHDHPAEQHDPAHHPDDDPSGGAQPGVGKYRWQQRDHDEGHDHEACRADGEAERERLAAHEPAGHAGRQQRDAVVESDVPERLVLRGGAHRGLSTRTAEEEHGRLRGPPASDRAIAKRAARRPTG
jgi:hypothetical protein